MTPDRRLDQLEPLMADVLQKTDRLIEGQGKILDVAVQADQNAETAARGVANLTTSTQKQLDEIKASQELLRVSLESVKTSQVSLQAGQELILQILREKLP